MLKIGRYGIALGRTFWVQTRVAMSIRHFLYFWFIREARPQDLDKKQRFPPNTFMEYEGRRYRYWKAPKDIGKGQVVIIKMADQEEMKGEGVKCQVD